MLCSILCRYTFIYLNWIPGLPPTLLIILIMTELLLFIYLIGSAIQTMACKLADLEIKNQVVHYFTLWYKSPAC